MANSTVFKLVMNTFGRNISTYSSEAVESRVSPQNTCVRATSEYNETKDDHHYAKCGQEFDTKVASPPDHSLVVPQPHDTWVHPVKPRG
jgi:hypothetical protein